MTRITITVEAETDDLAEIMLDQACMDALDGTESIKRETGANSYTVKVERGEG